MFYIIFRFNSKIYEDPARQTLEGERKFWFLKKNFKWCLFWLEFQTKLPIFISFWDSFGRQKWYKLTWIFNVPASFVTVGAALSLTGSMILINLVIVSSPGMSTHISWLISVPGGLQITESDPGTLYLNRKCPYNCNKSFGKCAFLLTSLGVLTHWRKLGVAEFLFVFPRRFDSLLGRICWKCPKRKSIGQNRSSL